jgi:magnesium chelatase subunit D
MSTGGQSIGLQLPALAQWVLALLAVDPVGLGGVVLRGGPGPLRDAWLDRLRSAIGTDMPWLKIPHHATESALLGGLDLPATLHLGRPVLSTGLLARGDGGGLVLTMAERAPPMTVALLSGAIDRRLVELQRDGQQRTWPCRWTLIALDEGREETESLPDALRDRLAFDFDPGAMDASDKPGLPDPPATWPAALATARQGQATVVVSDDLLQALAATAASCGVPSMRALLLSLRAARAAAALEGQTEVLARHAELAAALVLAPRATRLPVPADSSERAGEAGEEPPPQSATPNDTPPPPPPAPDADGPDNPDRHQDTPDSPNQAEAAQPLQDRLAEAVRVGLPASLLAQLQAGTPPAARSRSSGRFGASQDTGARGRVVGSRPGRPGGGARLHLIDTLRAAAPWQRIRRGARPDNGADPPALPVSRPVMVRSEDLRMARRRRHRPGTTVFVVDASGSSALHRMAEAKGAVELLLAECYVRRDQVAVLAFRGSGAQVLLPPTRSLVRAKRQLAALPGGGGTPLASGIEAARDLCLQIARRGESPTLVLLTDGRANIAADGAPGRERATADALAAAERLREQGLSALLIDTSPQPAEAARVLAQRMGARYLALPHAGASHLAQAVQHVFLQRPA